MKKVMRLIICLAVLLVTLPVLADEGQVVNFQKAVNLALQNNIDLKIAQLTLDNSQIDLEKSKISGDADTRAEQLSLDLDVAKSQDTYETAQYNIIYGLISDFIDLTKKRQAVELAEKQVRLKEMDLKQTNELFQRKSATNNDVKNAKSALDDQTLTLKKSKEDLARLIDNLKAKTGLKGDVQFKELNLNDITQLSLNLETAIQKALTASFEMKDRDTKLKLAELDLEKGQLESKPELELKKLANNKAIAEYRLHQTKDNVAQDVKDLFSSLEQSWKTIDIRSNDYEVAQKNFKQTSTGYQKGLYTETQFLQNNIALLNSDKALFSAKADYILKVAQLYNLLGDVKSVGGDLK